jgi:hypothetical protein
VPARPLPGPESVEHASHVGLIVRLSAAVDLAVHVSTSTWLRQEIVWDVEWHVARATVRSPLPVQGRSCFVVEQAFCHPDLRAFGR